MDKLNQLEDLLFSGTNELSLVVVLFNFIGAILVSFLVRAFYIRYSFSLTGKVHIGSVIPILTAIVFLVIVVVKSSLALSLGLVGALSIVRFRTPIKEPEELVYLFLAIAIGLGFGAGYSLVTTLISFCILVVIYFFLSSKNNSSSEYNLVINWFDQNISYESILVILKNLSSSVKLVRLEKSKETNASVFLIELTKKENLDLMINELKSLDEEIIITFFESKANW